MLEWGDSFQSSLLASLLFFGIAFLLLFYYSIIKPKRTSRFLLKSPEFLNYLKSKSNFNFFKLLYYTHYVLFFIGMILLLVALARPQKRNEMTNQSSEGINIMLVLDISDSMLIEDMEPENRLESAKLRIKEFIEKRISDRIGLVVFSGQSYTRIPLTLDYDLLLESVEMVKTSERIRKGTAIGVALANAVTRLQKSQGESNVIVLLTDGENNIGSIDPVTAMSIAKDYGIKIYTVGIGKDGLAQLPVFRKFPNGMVQKFYRPMHSTVNEELLTRMADETGGKFYRAEDSQNLNDVFSEIDQLEKTEVEVQKITSIAELFPAWNFWGLALIFISQLMYLAFFWRMY